MPFISSLVHRPIANTTPDSAPVDTSLDQRLLQACPHAHDLSRGPDVRSSIKPADMEKLLCAMMMSQWKAQILSPDPDDPAACPTLQVNPSW